MGYYVDTSVQPRIFKDKTDQPHPEIEAHFYEEAVALLIIYRSWDPDRKEWLTKSIEGPAWRLPPKLWFESDPVSRYAANLAFRAKMDQERINRWVHVVAYWYGVDGTYHPFAVAWGW